MLPPRFFNIIEITPYKSLSVDAANARICMLTEVGRSGKLLPTTGHRRSCARIMTLGVSGLVKLPVPNQSERTEVGQYPKPLTTLS
jgi:hypothetical protein